MMLRLSCLIPAHLRPCFAAIFTSSFSPSSPPRLLQVGDVLKESRRFTDADVAGYAGVTGDRNPIHLDSEFAREVGGFESGRIVHGMLVASLFPSIIASRFPGAVYVSQSLQFKLPVYLEDNVVAEVQAINMREIKKRYIVKFTTKCFKNGEHLVLDGEATTILPTLALDRLQALDYLVTDKRN